MLFTVLWALKCFDVPVKLTIHDKEEVVSGSVSPEGGAQVSGGAAEGKDGRRSETETRQDEQQVSPRGQSVCLVSFPGSVVSPGQPSGFCGLWAMVLNVSTQANVKYFCLSLNNNLHFSLCATSASQSNTLVFSHLIF